MTVTLKRVYEEASSQDGARVLVDRLWPRGLSKEKVALDAWLKEIAPSDELRKWYHAHPQQWSKFRDRYLKELAAEPAHTLLQQLYAIKNKRRRLTLLYASRNLERNNAVVLKDLLDGHRKPPTGTGPLRAAARSQARSARKS